MRKTKKVNTKRRQNIRAAFVGVAILALNLAVAAQDDQHTTDDNKKATDEKRDAKKKDYGVMFGTAYGPDDRPMYGVRVIIHPAGKKHPSWELYSDHRGEFAQRVPTMAADYIVTGEVQIAPIENGKPQTSKKKHLKGETKVHIDGAEWHDFSLHLN
jgi:hypothetical protein